MPENATLSKLAIKQWRVVLCRTYPNCYKAESPSGGNETWKYKKTRKEAQDLCDKMNGKLEKFLKGESV